MMSPSRTTYFNSLTSIQYCQQCNYIFDFLTGFQIPKILCASPLGMESGKIADSALVASSRYNQYWGPEQGRLYQQNEGKNGSNR